MPRAKHINIAEAVGATLAISLVPICINAIEADAIGADDIVIGTIRLLIATSGVCLMLMLKKSYSALSASQLFSLTLSS